MVLYLLGNGEVIFSRMNIDLYIAKKYLRHLSGSTGASKLHSPFAYEFYTNLLKDQRRYYSFRAIEKRRDQLLRDHSVLPVTDLGAGPKFPRTSRRVSDVARYSAKRAKYGQLLYRMVNYFNPKNILELGTSLGISTSYLASARSRSRVTTLEGWPEILDFARETFKVLKLNNITAVEGNFDDTLDGVLDTMPAIDLAFIDGNHQKEPTLRYFEKCLSKVHNNSILIFDDIYWKPDMEDAWNEIKAHPEVRLTIDTFHVGIVFFRKEIRNKQHFKFRY